MKHSIIDSLMRSGPQNNLPYYCTALEGRSVFVPALLPILPVLPALLVPFLIAVVVMSVSIIPSSFVASLYVSLIVSIA